MSSVVFVVPGRLDTLTGGYIYDRRMADGLRWRGWSVDIRQLDESFPVPTPAALEHAAHVLAALRDGAIALVDGLAFGAMPSIVEREASRLRLVALVHLPLAAAIGLDRDTATRLEAAERRSLAAARLIVATGSATLPLLAKYGVPPEKVAVVEPGTDRAPLAGGAVAGIGIVVEATFSGADVHPVHRSDPLQLLSVATLNPGKGHEILLRALASVPYHGWRLTCAGSLIRHPATVARVRATITRLGLEDHVSLVGELDAVRLADCYHHADLFVLATLQETYGMSVAEALAHGLPIVSTTTGAIPKLVGEAGVLVAPGNAETLAEALSRVLGDPGLRARLAEGARCIRDRLPTWEDAVTNMAAALEQLEPAKGRCP